jgi:hypothetical protein
MNAGKGDKPRPVDKKKYDNNYKKIFRSKKGYQGYQGYQGHKDCADCLKKRGIKKFKKTY